MGPDVTYILPCCRLFRDLQLPLHVTNHTLLHAELGFNAFFTLELILRAVASGGPKAYLSNAWNIFDLCMVLAGYTEFLPAKWFGKCFQ